MQEQIMLILEEIKQKLIIELQKIDNLELEKHQLEQHYNEVIANKDAEIAYLQEQLALRDDAAIMAKAQEIDALFGEENIPVPPPPYDKELYMTEGTPYALTTDGKVTLDKKELEGPNNTIIGYEVTIINYTYTNYSATIDGVQMSINAQSSIAIGFADELDGSILEIGGIKYLLINN